MTAILKLISRLPLPVLYTSSWLLYGLIHYLLRFRRELVRDNLRFAFPQLTESEIADLTRRFYRCYADVMVEMIKSLTISAQEITERVEIEGKSLLTEKLEHGQAVMVAAAHHCNIEWLMLALSAQVHYPFEAIYRPLSSPAMESLSTQAYTRFGGRLIKDRSVIREIVARKRSPRVVAIVPDQSPNRSDDTYWTEFLGRETGFFMAPDTIAKFAGYPVFFLGMRRTGRGRYVVSVKPIAAPPYRAADPGIVTAYVREVEQQVRASPADWLWIHRRWKRSRSLYG
jgi:KDO2-lipid IV(A) lauroyltransferase